MYMYRLVTILWAYSGAIGCIVKCLISALLLAGLPLPEEGLEDLSDLCRHVQGWGL